MKPHIFTDYHGTPSPFFPGLEVIHVDDEGREHRGVITNVDATLDLLDLAFDDGDAGAETAASCYAPEDAKIHIVVSQVSTYTFNVPLADINPENLVEKYALNDALHDWFCDQENNERDAITYEVHSREIAPGLNRRNA